MKKEKFSLKKMEEEIFPIIYTGTNPQYEDEPEYLRRSAEIYISKEDFDEWNNFLNRISPEFFFLRGIYYFPSGQKYANCCCYFFDRLVEYRFLVEDDFFMVVSVRSSTRYFCLIFHILNKKVDDVYIVEGNIESFLIDEGVMYLFSSGNCDAINPHSSVMKVFLPSRGESFRMETIFHKEGILRCLGGCSLFRTEFPKLFSLFGEKVHLLLMRNEDFLYEKTIRIAEKIYVVLYMPSFRDFKCFSTLKFFYVNEGEIRYLGEVSKLNRVFSVSREKFDEIFFYGSGSRNSKKYDFSSDLTFFLLRDEIREVESSLEILGEGREKENLLQRMMRCVVLRK